MSGIDVGTNPVSGTPTAYSRPGSAASRSDTALVTSYGYAADEAQTINLTGSPTGGTFTLAFGGNTTSGIAYNASAATVQSALQGLASIGSGNIYVTGSAGAYIIRFAGAKAGINEAQLTASSSLTGGTSPGVAIATTSQGGDNGLQQTVTDPRGIVAKTDYDMLGEDVRDIAAFTNFVPSDSDDQTTAYSYDGDGNVTAMTAVMPAGQNSQTTQYVYGVTSGGGSNITSNDLLKEVRYPDKSTGAAGTSSSDKEQYLYNALGEPIQMTDQNGNVHQYSYDTLGRQTADAVTTLGSGVDGTVRRLETTYNTQGLPEKFTSYDAASSGSVVNEVEDVYNGLGQLTTEYQEHSGAVNTSTSPKVQYSYVEMASGANNSRLTSMTYPNGRVLHYVYSSGLDDDISRLSYMADDDGSGGIGTHLEEYSYLGLDTIIRAARPEPGTELTYIASSNGDAGDKYAGLDRFGRVVDQRWKTTSGSTDLDRFQYGYDRDGNPLYKNNTVESSMSELYHASSSTSGDNSSAYDPLNRLTSFRRGTLTSSSNNGYGLDTITNGNLSALTGATRTWTLDSIGNQTATSADGASESNTLDSGNELTGYNGNTLTFDNNGNTTTNDAGTTFTFDAWNRLVGYRVSASAWGSYSYDALGRRITSADATFASDVFIQHSMFYTAAWQVAEDDWTYNYSYYDEDDNFTSSTTSYSEQFVWGASYIDDLVLRDRDSDGDSGTGSLGLSGSGLDERIYAQHDANHNVTSLTDTSGTVVQRFVYDPYGSDTVLSSSWSTTSDSYAWIYKFQGGRLETATGKYLFDHRDYDPATDTWMEEDPGGYVNGLSRYDFLTDNPVAFTDPLGLAKTRGDGHHIIPWAIFDGNVSDAVHEIWNGDECRIAGEGYTLHNGKNYGGVSQPEYRKAVEGELEKFLKEKRKGLGELSTLEAQEFAERIWNMDAKSTIGSYNRGVHAEMNAQTKSNTSFAKFKGKRLALGAAAIIGAILIDAGAAAGALADSPRFKDYISKCKDLVDRKSKGEDVEKEAFSELSPTSGNKNSTYWKLYNELDNIIGDAANRPELVFGSKDALTYFSERMVQAAKN